MPEIGPLRETTEQRTAEAEVLRGGNRRFLTATLSLVSLLAVGVAIAAGYMRGLQDREEQGPIPLLRAQVGEVKSRPENPGGIDPPHQDKLIYDRVAPGQSGKTVEQVRPAPEEPLESAIAVAAAATDDAPAAKATPDTSDTHAITQDAQVSAPAKSEQTESAPGADVAPKDEIAKASTEPGEDKILETPAAEAAATEPAAGGAANTGADTQPPPTSVAALPKDVYRVQLASFRTEKRAGVAWQQFAKAHGDAFAALEHFIVPADLGERGVYYRVQVGPFADKETAKEYCGLLRARSLSCIVVRK